MSRCPLCCSKVGRTARHDPSSPSARTKRLAGSLMGAGSSQVAAEPHDVVQHLGDQALASESARTIPPSPPCSDVNRSHTFAEAETEKPSAEMDKPRTEPAEPVRAAFEVEIVKRWAEQPIGLTLEGEGGPPFVKSVAEFSLVQDSKRIHPSQKLLSVNGIEVSDHASASAIIRSQEGPVVLKLIDDVTVSA